MTLLGMSREKMEERMKKYEQDMLNQSLATQKNDKTKSNSSSFVAQNTSKTLPLKEKE